MFFSLPLFPHDYKSVSCTVVCFALVEDAVDSGLYLQTSSCVGNCSVNQPMLLTTENSMAVWDHLPKMWKMQQSKLKDAAKLVASPLLLPKVSNTADMSSRLHPGEF